MSESAPIAFGGDQLDHAEHDRLDPDLVARLEKAGNSRCLVLHHGEILLDKDQRAYFVPPDAFASVQLYDPGVIFLGYDPKSAPVFAASVKDRSLLEMAGDFINMRQAAGMMRPHELAIAGRAKSLFDWHRRHRFCANCGKHTDAVAAGVKRKCEACETEHFPRVDPVVIMLVTDGDNCLLGRGKPWPEGYFSALAGFAEPGETLEEACRREVLEETGIKTGNVHYMMSQPWPFPSSIMIGLRAEATSHTITIDETELAEARWFTREELLDVMAGTHDDVYMPPPFTIAHQLLKAWLAD